jgi:hypothetical protein
MALKKVAAGTAAEIVAVAGLGEGVKAVDPGLEPAVFLEQLAQRGLFPDAVRFLAHALPKREAVWWACLCARECLTPETPQASVAALQAAERWVYSPTEENRREAMALAEAAKFDSPQSWAAVAAFWSGGSMAPANAPAVPPGETLTAAAAAGAIMLSAVLREPHQAADKYRRFLAFGLDIANGGSGRPRASAS